MDRQHIESPVDDHNDADSISIDSDSSELSSSISLKSETDEKSSSKLIDADSSEMLSSIPLKSETDEKSSLISIDADSSELSSSIPLQSETDEKTSSKSNDADSLELLSSFPNKLDSVDQLILKSENSSDMSTSFATISKTYEESRNKDTSKSSDISQENITKCVQSHQKENDTESIVLLPKPSSLLQTIKLNYQDTSSEDEELNDVDDDDYDDNDDDDKSVSSMSGTKEDFDIRTKGELSLNDLPPIEDLKISIEEEKCEPVGCIKSIVDTLVVVEAFLYHNALDIDSVLFVDRGQRALGKIFDVFGPVNKPYYAIRFNDSDHIKRFDIRIKEPVYCAPSTEYSNYILVSQLLKIKGSDASWKHNNEPPPELLDYSDDETERLAKKKRKKCFKSNANNSDGEKSLEPNGNSGAVDAAQNLTTSRNRRSKQNRNARHPKSNDETKQTFPTYAKLLGSVDQTRPRSVVDHGRDEDHRANSVNYGRDEDHRANSVNYGRSSQVTNNPDNYIRYPQSNSFQYARFPQHNAFNYNFPLQSNTLEYNRSPQGHPFEYDRQPQASPYSYDRSPPVNMNEYVRPPQFGGFDYNRPPQPNSSFHNRPPQPNTSFHNRPPQPNTSFHNRPPQPNSFDYYSSPRPGSYNYDQNTYLPNYPEPYIPEGRHGYTTAQPPNENNPSRPCNPGPYHDPNVM